MLGSTHKKTQCIPFVMTLCYGCCLIQPYFKKNEFALYILLLIISSKSSMLGVNFPDYDQSNINLCPSRDFFGKIVFGIIHLLGARHRSWHTHSFDFPLILLFGANYFLPQDNIIDILFLILVSGFCFGYITHLMFDIISEGGIIPSIILLNFYKFLVNFIRVIFGKKIKKYKDNFGVVSIIPDFIVVLKPKELISFKKNVILKKIPIIKNFKIKIYVFDKLFDGNYRTGSDYEISIRNSLIVVEPLIIIIGFIFSLILLGYGSTLYGIMDFFRQILNIIVNFISNALNDWINFLN